MLKNITSEVMRINELLHKYQLIESNKDLIKLWGYERYMKNV
jgi:hypothetical protein